MGKYRIVEKIYDDETLFLPEILIDESNEWQNIGTPSWEVSPTFEYAMSCIISHRRVNGKLIKTIIHEIN